MSPKAFTGFAVVTVLVIIGAAFSIANRFDVGTTAGDNEHMFPAFGDQVNDAGEILFASPGMSLRIVRDGDNWVIADRSNFPADAEVVRSVLVGLAELRKREAKTRKKELYERLQVEDLDAKDAKSKNLIVKDKSGKVLIDVIVGRENLDIAGPTETGRYVRVKGDQQSWLVAGRLDVPDAVNKWVSPEFMDVKNKRLAAVRVVQPDGKLMHVKRRGPDTDGYQLINLPESRKIKYQSDVDNIGDGLENLELEDVRAAGKIEFPADKTVKTEYRTADGLIVDVELYEEVIDNDSNFWARFKARVADDVAADKKEAVEKEAAEINEIVAAWIYKVPAFKYRYMTRKIEDVLEDEKKEAPASN